MTVLFYGDLNTLPIDHGTLQEWERTWDIEMNRNKCQVSFQLSMGADWVVDLGSASI